MATNDLHPWLATPEALAAAKKAVQIPLTYMGGYAKAIGLDELESEALAILTECALPPREQVHTLCAWCGGSLEGMRKGAKFCCRQHMLNHASAKNRGKKGAAPEVVASHVGSMWSWPEAEMTRYAVRTVGMLLNNYLRTRKHGVELAASEAMANMSLAEPEAEPTPSEVLEAFLVSRGVMVAGDESFDELLEAAYRVKGYTFGLVERVAA